MTERDDLHQQERKAVQDGAIPAPEPSAAEPESPVSSAETGESDVPPKDALSEEALAAGVDEVLLQTSKQESPVVEPVAMVEETAASSESAKWANGISEQSEDAEKPSVEIPPQEIPDQEQLDAKVRTKSRQHTRRSFAVAAVAAAAGYILYNWIVDSPHDEMQPRPMRQAFQTNAAISRAIFQERALAPTYALSHAENLRVNGVYGLKRALDPASWRLQVVGVSNAQRHPRFTADVTAWEYLYVDSHSSEDQGHDTKTPPPSALTAEKMAPESMVEQERQRENRAGRMPRGKEEAGQSRSTLPQGTGGLLLTMGDILRLPRHELVTQFKCIEGWSQIVQWAGVRMADFLAAYPPALVDGKEPRFVYMETPDGDYYTGYDIDVCRHPQTILVTEMMGAPLTQFHGAPLRLHMPTKYGYKQIKRIALISYTVDKPDDYWTKLGYDWYAGL
jgi:Oxidoreductase molybdopterin binding domain